MALHFAQSRDGYGTLTDWSRVPEAAGSPAEAEPERELSDKGSNLE
jgi:hypothetical protein